MKFVAKVLAASTLIILLTGTAQATPPQIDSGKIFVEQGLKPRKEIFPRVPVRPAPRHIPSKPRTTYDNRGGKQKIFAPPQVPHR